MKTFIIANWKMNFCLETARNFLATLEYDNSRYTILIAPPTPFLAHLKAEFPQLEFCAQDVSYYSGFGAKTGENSAKIIKSCQIDYALIGHSERRGFFNENNAIIREKIINCQRAGIMPIICIGEGLKERQEKTYKEFLLTQLLESLPPNGDEYIIAYEPLWSIGTGKLPNIAEIKEVFEYITNSKAITSLAKTVHLMYGGSVNVNNYLEILAIPYISGLLISSAALNRNEFNTIISTK